MNDDAKKELEELNNNSFEENRDSKRNRKSKIKKSSNKDNFQESSSRQNSDNVDTSIGDASNEDISIGDTNNNDNGAKKSCKGFGFLFLLLLGTWGFLGYEKYIDYNLANTAESTHNNDNSYDKLNIVIENNKSEIDKLVVKNRLLSQKLDGIQNKTEQLKNQFDYLNNQYESLDNKLKRNLSLNTINKDLNKTKQVSNNISKQKPTERQDSSNKLIEKNDKNIRLISLLNSKNDELIREKQLSTTQIDKLEKENSKKSKVIQLKDLVISSIGLKNDFKDKEKLEQYLSSIDQNYTENHTHSILSEIQDLEKYAINALVSEDYLKQEFNELINDINLKKLELNKDKSLTDKILYKTSKFVKVTKSDDSKSLSDIDGKLNLAKKHVQQSDFNLAYNQIKNIGSDYNDILSNWSSSVQLYTNAQNAIDKIISKLNKNIQNIQS